MVAKPIFGMIVRVASDPPIERRKAAFGSTLRTSMTPIPEADFALNQSIRQAPWTDLPSTRTVTGQRQPWASGVSSWAISQARGREVESLELSGVRYFQCSTSGRRNEASASAEKAWRIRLASAGRCSGIVVVEATDMHLIIKRKR